MLRTLTFIDQAIGVICKYLSIAMLLALFVLLGMGVVLRMMPLFTIRGYEEIVEFLFIWIIVLTTVALWREGSLYRVSMVEHMLPRVGQLALAIVINLAMLVFALMLAYYGWRFAAASGETTAFLRMDKTYWYAALPFGGIMMSIYSLVWLWRVVAQRKTLDQDSNLIS